MKIFFKETVPIGRKSRKEGNFLVTILYYCQAVSYKGNGFESKIIV